MRTLLRVQFDTEAANEASSGGEGLDVLQRTIERLQPEAAYFTPEEDGARAAFFVFDLEDPSEMPVIAEPLYQTFRARIRWSPVMNQEDLQKGLSQLG